MLSVGMKKRGVLEYVKEQMTLIKISKATLKGKRVSSKLEELRITTITCVLQYSHF